MNNTKLTKTASVLERIMKFLRSFCLVIACIVAAFAVLTLFLGERMTQPGSLTLDMGFIRLTPSESYQSFTPGMKYYTCLGLASTAVICYMMHCGVGLLQKVFSCAKEGRPFETSVSENLRKLAWLVLIGGSIAQVLILAQEIVLAKVFPFGALFAADALAHYEFLFTFDANYLVVFVLLLLLSYIFSYGQMLQQDVDDTV